LTFTHSLYSPEIAREPTWQAVVENGDSPQVKTSRKDPKYVTHGIHAYKGKFYPQLAKSLFNLAGLMPKQSVLDPFCGSGTVLLEAYLNGLKGIGSDLNPLAVKIARAKTQILEVDPYLCDRMFARMQERLASMESSERWLTVFPTGLHAELLSWFPRPVVCKLGWLINEISTVPDHRVREFLEVLVSSIVRDISQQEPSDLRIRRREQAIVDASVREKFAARLSEQRKRLKHFAERANRAPVQFVPGQIIEGDCRDPHLYADKKVSAGTVDAIVTSPPYATALPYIDTDRLSLLLLFGLAAKKSIKIEEALTGSRDIVKKTRDELEAKIDAADYGVISSPTAQTIIARVRAGNRGDDAGFRRKNLASLLYRYFTDMAVVLRNLDRLLAPGAPAFFVIGDNKTEAGGTVVPITSSVALQEIGTAIGWKLVDVLPITVTTENRVHSKNSITDNDVIFFRKSD
jgi:hypothetical protein